MSGAPKVPLETGANGKVAVESADGWVLLRAQQLVCISVCSMTAPLLFPDAAASDYRSTWGTFQDFDLGNREQTRENFTL